MLWLKALHLFFMVAWFAGIFYLPRLFVYHADASNRQVQDTFVIMQRRLWWFVTPFAVLTLVFGAALMHSYGGAWIKASPWLHIKLTLVALLYVYHGYLYLLHRDFARRQNRHSARFYRVLNEAPVLVLFAIIVLAVVKPTF